jgi:hypothetical protein
LAPTSTTTKPATLEPTANTVDKDFNDKDIHGDTHDEKDINDKGMNQTRHACVFEDLDFTATIMDLMRC